ncbi:MAG: ExbD/TolR family protein [Elusimicrobiales bacterium]
MELKIPDRKHKHLDLTPLIDVMFNLLLFFLLTYQVSKYSEIKINLPSSNSDNPVSKGVEITVKSDSEIYFNGKKTNIKEIDKFLSSVNKSENILIKSDKEVKIDLIVKIIDEIKRNNFENIGIITYKN